MESCFACVACVAVLRILSSIYEVFRFKVAGMELWLVSEARLAAVARLLFHLASVACVTA